MPIISNIGRKHPRTRALTALIYGVLLLGSVTMIYPFLIMLSGSTKSAVDVKDFDIIPKFLFDDAVLYRKHLEGLFNESIETMNVTYDADIRSFEVVEPPAASHKEFVAAWHAFLASGDLPGHAYAGGYMRADVSKTTPQGLREFKASLQEQFGADIHKVNRALGKNLDHEPAKNITGWNAFYVVPEDYLNRRSMPANKAFFDVLWAFKEEQGEGFHYYFSPAGFFKKLYLKSQYTKDVDEYNRAHGTSYTSYDEIDLDARQPDGSEEERADWEIFVRETLSPLWIRADDSAADAYRNFLEAKYGGMAVLNRNYETSYESFEKVPLIEQPPYMGLELSDWNAFLSGWKDPDTGITHKAPLDALSIHSVEILFRDHLLHTHGSVGAINEAMGMSFQSPAEIKPPQREAHYLSFLDMRADLRREFVTRNYRTVVDYLVLHGRGVFNTAVYCGLAILFALLVNPLAAYAMSRYRMPSAYKILLFLMLTMAFPPMVTQIPLFLMLRELNLLNTFAALILPGLAHGYSIFLLKGFFDSLPQDLYDSAAIDGASEWRMFWTITMSLSKPILAVIALQAFTIAYSNFMFALLICQDEKMWTLMVWLYQLQQVSGPAVMYASLIVAAIPTLIIFIFCQNIIIRGIVIPVEK